MGVQFLCSSSLHHRNSANQSVLCVTNPRQQGCPGPVLKGHSPAGFSVLPGRKCFRHTKWQSQVKALDCSPRGLSLETRALEKRIDLLLIFCVLNGRCCSCSRTQTWKRRGKPSWRRLGAKRRSSNRRSRRAWTNRSKGNRRRNCWRENGQKRWLRIQPELSDHYPWIFQTGFQAIKSTWKSTVFYSVEQRTTMLWWNFTAKKSECQTDLHHTEISTFIYLCPSTVENQGLMQTLL